MSYHHHSLQKKPIKVGGDVIQVFHARNKATGKVEPVIKRGGHIYPLRRCCPPICGGSIASGGSAPAVKKEIRKKILLDLKL